MEETGWKRETGDYCSREECRLQCLSLTCQAEGGINILIVLVRRRLGYTCPATAPTVD